MLDMDNIYKSKVKSLAGTSYSEVITKARKIYKDIASKTKRRPYIRSKYFNKEKIFLEYFWSHLMTKNRNDRFRRLRLYASAIDLIENSKIKSITVKNPNKSGEILHRFEGINQNTEQFIVQIKEDVKTEQKHFISVFPK